MACLAVKILFFTVQLHGMVKGFPNAKKGCQTHCGNLTIPFPFGIGRDCSIQPEFSISCDQSTTPPLAKLFNKTVTSFADGQLTIKQDAARKCSNESNEEPSKIELNLPSPYPLSSTNNFYVIGCNALATYHAGEEIGVRATPCLDEIPKSTKSCIGYGCSKLDIPGGIHNFSYELSLFTLNDQQASDNKCSYAFIVRYADFKFDPESSFDFVEKSQLLMPVLLNWAIGNQSCNVHHKCQGNAFCVDRNTTAEGMVGYLCKCHPGYHGNPYLGCEDIDECATASTNCENGKCVNTVGNYSCACNRGFENFDNMTCIRIKKSSSFNTLSKFLLGLCVGVLVLGVVGLWFYKRMNKKRLARLRRTRFNQNGGQVLQELINNGGIVETRIFTEEELNKATNNYDVKEIVGEGGFGTVYRGKLVDNTVVAVKKPKSGALTTESDQFANEVTFLSRINHRNVVKLLGCCCECELPTLVYEYINQGNLHEHLFNSNGTRSSLSWEQRLKIASGTASALAYLHSEASTPIIHRDVKTMNILLDEDYNAKLSDFGASRFIPLDQSQLVTLVQGTYGYLDPEYFHTSELTEKSDVYSFGVVLAEMLTGKVAFSFSRPDKERCLASFFVSSMEDRQRLIQILDAGILDDEGNMHTIEQAAKLAKLCLMMKSDQRPTMKQVSRELEGMTRVMAKGGLEETRYLLGSPALNITSSGCGDGASSSYTK